MIMHDWRCWNTDIWRKYPRRQRGMARIESTPFISAPFRSIGVQSDTSQIDAHRPIK
jgi:hypothetical protein